MTNHRTRHTTRYLAWCTALGLAIAPLAACGDDDADDGASAPPDTVAEDTTAEDTTADAFCEGLTGIDAAFANAPEDEAEIPAFIEEQVQPNIDLVNENAPDEIADEVQVMTGTVEEVANTGDFSLFGSPEFGQASEAVYTSLDDVCGMPVIEVDAMDFQFEGVPETLEAGPAAIVMSNEGTEMHELVLAKLSDDTELSVDEMLALPEEEAEQHIETFAGGVFAPPGMTAGTTVELTPGRWIYICFVPVGSVGDAEGSGPPHFVEGMVGELTVE